MSDDLVFMMGNFEAHLPRNLMYAKNHMWARVTGEESRFGLSAYAVRLLQDVYFLDWSVDAGAELQEKAEIGEIESSKAESSLYAPAAGRLTRFNEQLLKDPSAINTDKYGDGWLFAMQGDLQNLLSPEEYIQHLEESWKVAERTIKGQLN